MKRKDKVAESKKRSSMSNKPDKMKIVAWCKGKKAVLIYDGYIFPDAGYILMEGAIAPAGSLIKQYFNNKVAVTIKVKMESIIYLENTNIVIKVRAIEESTWPEEMKR